MLVGSQGAGAMQWPSHLHVSTGNRLQQPTPPAYVVVIGMPGAGKGTQAKWLVRQHNLCHMEMGQVLRDEVKANTMLGRKIAQFKQQHGKGAVIPDSLITPIARTWLAQHSDTRSTNLLWDGYPRTRAQTSDFFSMVWDHRPVQVLTLFLHLEEEVARERLLNRNCGRDDDTASAIKQRFGEFRELTQPAIGMLHHWAKTDPARIHFRQIDADQPVDTIAAEIDVTYRRIAQPVLVPA